jgi:type IV pilus assembly protein PilW
MKNKHMTPSAPERRLVRGFTLVELMVALALGMLLTVAMTFVYLNSRTAFSRQQQLSSIQQSVRVAFEYLSNDARMAGHVGCYTGLPMTGSTFNTALSTTSIASNFAIGIEGYEYSNATAGTYTLGSSAPADNSTASNWATNAAVSTSSTVPMTSIAGTGNGLTPGSDVLVIRTVAGRPVRLSANTVTGDNKLVVENLAGQSCADGSAKVSGFCPSSYGLVASCNQARVFQLGTGAIVAQTLALTGTLGADPLYKTDDSEVFPLQTVVYYVRKSSIGTATSLYRRVFDGNTAGGIEQELIEGVESLQIRYGVDTTLPTPNGVVDTYVAAKGPLGDATDSVMDWSKVVAVRMGLLIRSTTPLESDLAAALPASAPVNGVSVVYPTTGTKYDRRVFTTTVAVRNRIAYF